MKTYDFRVHLEPDEEGWRAFCPPLESLGASTWGESQEEALKNIHEVLTMIVEERLEAKQPILEQEGLASGGGALVSVTL
ncbi:MAG: type II toxin-antitoxin system HicB family antitoxin [Chloroflexi bacterium]|nr:type II toxin-antitoxin system HicB family antitoxin [Chloroflexota bacterium]